MLKNRKFVGTLVSLSDLLNHKTTNKYSECDAASTMVSGGVDRDELQLQLKYDMDIINLY
jgi:hypothetical protein